MSSSSNLRLLHDMIHDLSLRDQRVTKDSYRPRIVRRNRKLLNEALALQHALIKQLGFAAELDGENGFDPVMGYGWGTYMVTELSGNDIRFYFRGVPSEKRQSEFRPYSYRPLLDSIWAEASETESLQAILADLRPFNFKSEYLE